MKLVFVFFLCLTVYEGLEAMAQSQQAQQNVITSGAQARKRQTEAFSTVTPAIRPTTSITSTRTPTVTPTPTPTVGP